MTIQVGSQLPDVAVRWMSEDGVQSGSIRELFAGKRVVLFSVPGAFTPTCSDEHLPGFVVRRPEILAKGVDQIACVAVNDVFVMSAWGEARQIGDQILFLSDGNGELATAMGLELDLRQFGMGPRAKRYAAIFEDSKLTWLGVEPEGGVTVSSADAVLEAL